MVSSTTRAERNDPLASLIDRVSNAPGSAKTFSSKSFAQQLARTVEGTLKQSSNEAGRDSAGSQFLVSLKASTTIIKAPGAPSATATPPSDVPTMLGMGPVAGTAPVQQIVGTQPVAPAAPVTEADAYWAAQPAAVQALRDMPDGAAKDQLALKLANQGYSIDTQIMVWGWDPQMTMTVRANQGYSWVPGYGQSNIPIGPGLSMPGNPNSYSPGNPPPGAIEVSTAFAAGTIQNPLVQTDYTGT